MPQTGNQPVKEFKAGRIRAAIWKNEVEQNGQTVSRFSVKIESRYRDKKTGEWKSTNQYFPEDLPKVTLVSAKAFEYTSLRESEDDPELPTVAR